MNHRDIRRRWAFHNPKCQHTPRIAATIWDWVGYFRVSCPSCELESTYDITRCRGFTGAVPANDLEKDLNPMREVW